MDAYRPVTLGFQRGNDRILVVGIEVHERHKAGILLGIVAIFYIATRLVECGKFGAMASLAGSSFLVFALHTLVMDDIGKVLFTALNLPINMGTLLLLYFIVPSFTILFCLGMYLILKRIAPSLCNLLTGGR